jgi:hypothetical protein
MIFKSVESIDYFRSRVALELRLLMTCVFPSLSTCWRLEDGKEIDWNIFIRYMVWHRLTPGICDKLLMIYPEVPLRVLQQLRDKSRESMLKSLKYAGEMATISDNLLNAGILHYAFKGAALSLQLYGNCTSRQFRDIDLLVDPKDTQKALILLLKEGYKIINPDFPDSLVKQAQYYNWYMELCLHHASKNITVELHWSLVYLKPEILAYPFPCLIGNLEELTLGNKRIPTFHKNFVLLHLLQHGSMHNWFRLFWIRDIIAILNTWEIDWSYIIENSRRYHFERSVQQGLSLAALLDENVIVKIPPFLLDDSSIQHRLVSDAQREWLIMREQTSLTNRYFNTIHNFRLLRRWQDKLLLLWIKTRHVFIRPYSFYPEKQ